MKKNRRFIWILTVLVVINSLLLTSCLSQVKVKRISEESDVPAEVWAALKNVTIEPGAYFFSANFTKNKHAYIAICGNKTFTVGYDVKIKDIEYKAGDIDNGTIENGRFFIDIVEESAASRTSYSQDAEYPFVFFELTEKSPFDRIYLTANGEVVPINYWWGAEDIKKETSLFTYEVIQDRDDIPDEIWSVITTLKLERGLFDFEQSDYVADTYYCLLCGGEEYLSAYNIAFEEVKVSETSRDEYGVDAFLTVTMREYAAKGYLTYAQGFAYPFAVIKIEAKDNKAYSLMGGREQFICVLDDHAQSSILFMNWDMRP